MNKSENTASKTPANDKSKRTGLLQKLSQLAEALEFDPQEALFLELKALRNEVRELRQAVRLSEK